MASHMRGEYKTCIRYGMTRAGRRCAKYGPGKGLSGEYKTCLRYERTRAGRRCAKYRSA